MVSPVNTDNSPSDQVWIISAKFSISRPTEIDLCNAHFFQLDPLSLEITGVRNSRHFLRAKHRAQA